jgi:hypothetical protein
MMTNNHTLFSSLYEDPPAAGAASTDLLIETASHDWFVGHLVRNGLNDESAIELPTVRSVPCIPAGVAHAFTV